MLGKSFLLFYSSLCFFCGVVGAFVAIKQLKSNQLSEDSLQAFEV